MFTFLLTVAVLAVAIAAAVSVAVRDPDQPATLQPKPRRERRPKPPPQPRPAPAPRPVAMPEPVERGGGLADHWVPVPAGVSVWVRLRSGFVLTMLLAVLGALLAASISGVLLLFTLAIRNAVS